LDLEGPPAQQERLEQKGTKGKKDPQVRLVRKESTERREGTELLGNKDPRGQKETQDYPGLCISTTISTSTTTTSTPSTAKQDYSI